MDAKDARIAELSAENEAMRPKALLGEAVEPSRATYTVTEAARYVAQVVPSARRQDVFDLLRGAGMMCKGSTAPTREGIDTGRMVAVSHEFENGRGETVHRQTGRLTGKGLAWVVSRMTERAVA